MTAKYQKKFDINPGDLELIENALLERARTLCLQMLDKQSSDKPGAGVDCLNSQMQEIQMLLGKLHNQKIWYAPPQYVPRG